MANKPGAPEPNLFHPGKALKADEMNKIVNALVKRISGDGKYIRVKTFGNQIVIEGTGNFRRAGGAGGETSECSGAARCYSLYWELFHCDQEIVGSCHDMCVSPGGWQQIETGTLYFSFPEECLKPPENPAYTLNKVWDALSNDGSGYTANIFTDEMYNYQVVTPFGSDSWFNTDPSSYRTVYGAYDDGGAYKLAKVEFGALSSYSGTCPTGTAPDMLECPY